MSKQAAMEQLDAKLNWIMKIKFGHCKMLNISVKMIIKLIKKILISY